MGALKDCEAVVDSLIGQPVNSMTAVVFIVAGGVVWALSRQAAIALALVATGIGSFLFHGPMPSYAQLVHDITLWFLVAVATITIVVEYRQTGAWRHLIGPMLLLGTVAVIGRMGATGGPLCDPDSIWQPHGLWHIGAAVAVTWWALSRPRQ